MRQLQMSSCFRRKRKASIVAFTAFTGPMNSPCRRSGSQVACMVLPQHGRVVCGAVPAPRLRRGVASGTAASTAQPTKGRPQRMLRLAL